MAPAPEEQDQDLLVPLMPAGFNVRGAALGRSDWTVAGFFRNAQRYDLVFFDDIMLVLYRLIQEGRTNSFRHGRATRIKLIFGYDADQIHVVIRDNGHGASEITDGIGFSGMRERLSAFKGKLEARNLVNGFELLATIPVTTVTYKGKKR